MTNLRCDCGDSECPSCGTAQGTHTQDATRNEERHFDDLMHGDGCRERLMDKHRRRDAIDAMADDPVLLRVAEFAYRRGASDCATTTRTHRVPINPDFATLIREALETTPADVLARAEREPNVPFGEANDDVDRDVEAFETEEAPPENVDEEVISITRGGGVTLTPEVLARLRTEEGKSVYLVPSGGGYLMLGPQGYADRLRQLADPVDAASAVEFAHTEGYLDGGRDSGLGVFRPQEAFEKSLSSQLRDGGVVLREHIDKLRTLGHERRGQ